MARDVLAFVVLLGSGTTAGVMFAVALSMVPALVAMPVDRYLEAHRLLGRNWDPTMPVLVLSTTAAGAGLALLPGPVPERALYGLVTVLMLAVAGVSHLCNVPINRSVKSLDPAAPPPAGWRDPRPRWRGFHLLRTVLAMLAFLASLTTVLLVQT